MDTDVRRLTTVWLVVRREERPKARPNLSAAYHFQGVATDEEKAVQLCRDHTYIIGPFPVNVALPESQTEWIGSYSPLDKDGNRVSCGPDRKGAKP